MNGVQVKVAIDGHVRDAGQGQAVLEFLELLLVAEDDELVIVGADADVEGLSLLEGVALAVFLAPLAVGERVQHDLQYQPNIKGCQSRKTCRCSWNRHYCFSLRLCAPGEALTLISGDLYCSAIKSVNE